MRLIEEKYVSDDLKRRILIKHDPDAENPREWCNLGTMVCWHSRYILGDEQPSCSPQDYRMRLAEEMEEGLEAKIDAAVDRMYDQRGPLTTGAEWDAWDEDVRSYVNERIDKILEKHCIILPLYLYDHSGITMNVGGFSCPWDSGQVGFIYVSKAKVRQEYGWKRITEKRLKQVESYLKGEVKVYDKLLTGEVYGFVAERLMPCPDDWELEEWSDCDAHWEEEDSCWGFFGMDIIENGILDHLDDEFTQVFCEAEGITLEQLKAEQDEFVASITKAA